MQLHLEKRLSPSPRRTVATYAVALGLALLAGAVLLAAVGAQPLTTYRAMLVGALGSRYALSETLVKATPLMLAGLAVALAFRMKFWNIGAEGQMAMGAFASTGVALFGPPLFPWLPQPLWLPLALLAGAAAGTLWGLIPAALKAYLAVNEIIATLMLNYIAIGWIEFLFYGPWKDPAGFGFPGTAQWPRFAWLPKLAGWGRVHAGLLLALGAALLLWFLLSRTRWGYEVRLMGENALAARYAGVNVARTTLVVMALSGTLAGLAGAGEISGIAHRLQQGLLVGDGFTAIIVAWLARLNPWGVLVVAFGLAALLVGGDQLQITSQLPKSIGGVLQGLIFFFVLGAQIFTRYQLRRR